jgi:hypothetical protein
MPKTDPIYSKKQKNVYHNNSKCTERNNIEKENIAHGTGRLPLCKRCKELNDQGK